MLAHMYINILKINICDLSCSQQCYQSFCYRILINTSDQSEYRNQHRCAKIYSNSSLIVDWVCMCPLPPLFLFCLENLTAAM